MKKTQSNLRKEKRRDLRPVVLASMVALIYLCCTKGPDSNETGDGQTQDVRNDASNDETAGEPDATDDDPLADSEPDAGLDLTEDNSAATGDTVVHPPIYITINAHGHNYGFPERMMDGFVSDGDLEGWYDTKRNRYETQRAEIMWLAEETERIGARMSYQLNGEYARDARILNDDVDHLLDLVDRGHSMSAHFHPYVFTGENEYWENVTNQTMTEELMANLWASHLDEIEETIGFGVSRADAAHDRDNAELQNYFNQLREDYGLTVENVGESFSGTHWAHRPWNVFRRDVDTELLEDLDGPVLAVHSYPQVGREAPQGLHTVISTVPQLKRRFIDVYFQWLYAQKTGQTPRVWTFGLMTHPDSNRNYQDEMLDIMNWLAEWTDAQSPWGGPVAEFTTDYDLAETFEQWEADYPGTSSFSFDLEAYDRGEDVPYPYDLEGMVLGTHDGEFVGTLTDWEDDGVIVVELVHRNVERGPEQPNGAVETTVLDLGLPLYVLWTHGDPVTIDFSNTESGTLYVQDGMTGEITGVDASEIEVSEVPIVVSSTDEYFSNSED